MTLLITHSSAAVEQLRGTALAYHYFVFDDARSRQCDTLVRALVKQIAGYNAKTRKILEDLYDEFDAGNQLVDSDELKNPLKDLLNAVDKVYIVIDALDESSEVQEVLDLLEEICDWQIPSVHLLASSRKSPEIEFALKPLVSSQVPMRNDSVNEDISRHIEHQLQKRREFARWTADIKAEIRTRLVEDSKGM